MEAGTPPSPKPFLYLYIANHIAVAGALKSLPTLYPRGEGGAWVGAVEGGVAGATSL